MQWKWKTILSFGINFGKNKEKSNENINKQSDKYNKQALNVHKHVDKVTDIIIGRKPSEDTSHEAPKDGKNTKVLTKKLEKLIDTVENMEISGRHNETSIDALKEQVKIVESVREELRNNLKKLSDVPSEIKKLSRERKNLRKEEHALKQQNNKLDELEKQVKDKKEIIDKKRTINNKKLTGIEEKLNKNEAQIKSFSTGEKTREFGVNIQNSFNKFKTEIAKLATQIKSLEKGQAAQQNIMDQAIPEGLKLQEPLKPSLKPSWCDRDAENKEKASNDKGNGVRF